MRGDFFLRAAVEWLAVAEAIRRTYPTVTGSFHATVCGLYREAAWCHLLLREGQFGAAVARLQAVHGRMFGERIPSQPDGTEAAEFFHRFRSAATERYPLVFGSPIRVPA